jgi:hypothetical protein
METCKACGARLTTSDELDRHNKEMHPGMAGKKGGQEDKERKPLGRPID